VRSIAAGGPISLAHYMAQVNAYYYGSRDPLGAAGDFTTAPEISQMFGELVGLALADVWTRSGQTKTPHYVELGPGRGTLATDALRAMQQARLAPTVHFVETSVTLRERQREAVPHASFHDDIDSVPTDAPLLIVANEFFDALPIAQAVRTEDGWHLSAQIAPHELPKRFREASVMPSCMETGSKMWLLGQMAHGL